MKITIMAAAVALSVGMALNAGTASAQAVVFDPTNFAQNLQQVAHMLTQLQKLQQQIKTAQDQLQQQKQQYAAITGSRGMGTLQTDNNRGYIPRSWQETLSGNGQIGALAGDIKRSAGYLEDKNLTGLNDAYRKALRRSGDQAATGMAANAAVFQEAGGRFQRLQTLMDRIETASDDKAVQDLSARIQVEQVMLQNEMIRAQSMNAMVLQQQQVEKERQRQGMMSHSFDY